MKTTPATPNQTPESLWRASLFVFLLGSLIGLGLVVALALGWRSATPRRPPDWQPAGADWVHQGGGQGQAVDGAYRLALEEPNQLGWAVGGPSLSDFYLEADLRSLTAGQDNGYGLVYGYRDPANYHLFAVGGDGNYAIMAVADGRRRALRPWQPWPHVRRGAARNRLRIECRAANCRFYVNGEFTAEVHHGAAEAGQVGLFAQTFSDGSLTLACEALSLWSLGP